MRPLDSLIGLGRRRPALVGVQALVALAVLLAVALNAGRLPIFTGETFRAVFSDASGLQEGTEVRVAGITVGKVREIDLAGDRVVVTFDVTDVELGEETRAGIEIKTLLGQHYLSVTPAGPGRMEEGETIPESRTTTPLSIVPALQQLSTTTAALDTDQIAGALDALSGVLESATPEVRGTLTGIARLSRTVASRDQQLRQLFSSADTVTGVLATRDAEVVSLFKSSQQVLETLDRRRRVVEDIVDAVARLSRQLSGLVADNRETLRPALDKVDRVLAMLREHRRDLDDSLRLVATYGRLFTSVAGSGRWFDGSITTPRGYALCSSGADGAANQILDPVLSRINRSVNGSDAACLPFGPAADSREAR
jgi:phospholipid/cholesterol/gamma-HCH transport system substrate-binding protein